MTKRLLALLVLGVLLLSAGVWMLASSDPQPAGGTIATAPQVEYVLSQVADSSRVGPKQISGLPERIKIPDLGIDLTIHPGYYDSHNRSWTLSPTDAQYAAILGPTNNQTGLTFIYAHYKWGVFYQLPNIKPGMKAILSTGNGHTFTYVYKRNVIVPPSNTQIFNYTGKPILVAQTCTGAWYQNRQLFIFDLEEAK